MLKKKEKKKKGKGYVLKGRSGQSERAHSGKSWNNWSKKAVQCWILTQTIK